MDFPIKNHTNKAQGDRKLDGLSGAIQRGEDDNHHSKDLLAIGNFINGYETRFRALQDYFLIDDWTSKSVLDIGCGQGGFGFKFADAGAKVTFIDGRDQNLQVIRDTDPEANTVRYDLETGDPIPVETADLSMFMGALYHVGEPTTAIRAVAETSDNICLETACLDHDGVALIYFEEETDSTSFSINGGACRPSPKWVEIALEQAGFPLVQDISCTEFNVPVGPGYSGLSYDWELQRTCGWRRNEYSLRKLWIASKSQETTIFKAFK